MRVNHEQIYQLLLQKRNGTINESDDQYVSGLISVHEEIDLMWRALKHSFSLPGEENFWSQIDTANAWNIVKADLSTKRTSSRANSRWLLAAAVVVAGLTGIGMLWKSNRQTAPAVAKVLPARATAGSGLQLVMADGKTVDLPYNQPQQQINTGDVQLNAGAKKLQYTAASKQAEGYNTLVVPPKMDYKLTLADGTEVWLNATSKLKFPFTFQGSKREVYLEGEAYFQVKTNAEKPFVVHTEQTDIEVLGTSFNVTTYKDVSTKTSLVSGAVISRSGDEKVALKPGQEAVFTAGKGYNVRHFDEDEVLAWMKGIYIFRNTPLQEIAEVIDRWYGVKVIFDDPSLAAKKFTGGLEKQQKLDYFLETLQLVGDISHYSDNQGTVHLK